MIHILKNPAKIFSLKYSHLRQILAILISSKFCIFTVIDVTNLMMKFVF